MVQRREIQRALGVLGSAGLLDRQVCVVRSLERGCATVFLEGATERVTGFDPSFFDEDPRRWDGLVHPDDLPMVSAELDRLARRGTGSFEYRIRGRAGRVPSRIKGRRIVVARFGAGAFVVRRVGFAGLFLVRERLSDGRLSVAEAGPCRFSVPGRRPEC